MATTGDDVDPQLVEELVAQADLLTPYALRVAATLGLADHVAAGVTDVDALAEVTGTDLLALRALVAHLADTGTLALDADGRVGLTELGRLLLDDHPTRARHRLRLDHAQGQMDQAWAGLLHTVRTGRPGHDLVHGRGFWARMEDDPVLARSFDAYLTEWARVWVPLVVAAHDWTRYDHIVDAAGGSGLLLAAVLDATPAARGTVVELATTAALATAELAGRGLGERATAVVGDLFGELPAADAVVLAQVLHDWDDEDATRILATAARAVGADGRVVVVERLVDGAFATGQARMALLMRNLFGATERSRDDFVALAAGAGLELVGSVPTDLGLSVIEFGPGVDRGGSRS